MQTTGHVETLWMEELDGICPLGGHCVLTMHPQVMGRPSRVALLDRLIGNIRSRDVWIATCAEVASRAEDPAQGEGERAMKRFEGRRAIVTGAAGGIGAAIVARLLAKAPRSRRSIARST